MVAALSYASVGALVVNWIGPSHWVGDEHNLFPSPKRVCQEYRQWKNTNSAKWTSIKALLQSHPDPMTADKITDLRDKFRDAFTGWLEIEDAA